MLLLLMMSIIGLTIAEIAVILQSGRLIGPWWTLVLLVVSSFLGAWLWRREGTRAWRALVRAFESGRMPAGELTDAALVLVGGLLLMLPGFLTDIVGLFFLLPLTRPLARRAVAAFVSRSASAKGVDIEVLRAKVHPETVIRGETVDDPVAAPASGQRTPPSQRPETVILKGEIEG